MSGYLIDSGGVSVQASRDLNDSEALRGCRHRLWTVGAYARGGAVDSSDLQSALENVGEVYREVFGRFADALETLGYAQQVAVDNYESAEGASTHLYSRMGGGGATAAAVQ